MVLIDQQARRLQIRVIPLGVWFFGLLFFSLGVMAGVARSDHTLVCRHNAQLDCVLTHEHPLGLRTPEHAEVPGLVHARVESTQDGDAHHVVLDTANGTQRLSPSSFGTIGDSTRAAMENINAAIDAGDREFHVRAREFLPLSILAIASLAAGTLSLSAARASVVMDVDAQSIVVTQRRWLRTETQTQPLASLAELMVKEKADTSGGTYRIEMVTREGTIPLTEYYASYSRGMGRAYDAMEAFVREHTDGVHCAN